MKPKPNFNISLMSLKYAADVENIINSKTDDFDAIAGLYDMNYVKLLFEENKYATLQEYSRSATVSSEMLLFGDSDGLCVTVCENDDLIGFFFVITDKNTVYLTCPYVKDMPEKDHAKKAIVSYVSEIALYHEIPNIIFKAARDNEVTDNIKTYELNAKSYGFDYETINGKTKLMIIPAQHPNSGNLTKHDDKPPRKGFVIEINGNTVPDSNMLRIVMNEIITYTNTTMPQKRIVKIADAITSDKHTIILQNQLSVRAIAFTGNQTVPKLFLIYGQQLECETADFADYFSLTDPDGNICISIDMRSESLGRLIKNKNDNDCIKIDCCRCTTKQDPNIVCLSDFSGQIADKPLTATVITAPCLDSIQKFLTKLADTRVPDGEETLESLDEITKDFVYHGNPPGPMKKTLVWGNHTDAAGDNFRYMAFWENVANKFSVARDYGINPVNKFTSLRTACFTEDQIKQIMTKIIKVLIK